jgi:hypothetical protein
LKSELDFAPNIGGEDKRIALAHGRVGDADAIFAGNVLDSRIGHGVNVTPSHAKDFVSGAGDADRTRNPLLEKD